MVLRQVIYVICRLVCSSSVADFEVNLVRSSNVDELS